MEPMDPELATAHELALFANKHGMDLAPLLNESAFQNNQRWIIFWRKSDGDPSSGRPDEPEGTLHYNMQGTITALPDAYWESADVFHGGWTEAGILESIEQAFELVKAWVHDGKEVDELPPRLVRRSGIG